jgi:hypothetical protein
MTPSMPIATDNIYKLAALFGVAVLIAAILSIGYTYGKYFESVYVDLTELEMLKAKDTLSSDESIKKKNLEIKLNTDQANKKFIINFLLGCIGGSIALSAIGGSFWLARVQPKQDKLLNLQIEKMRREIQVLDKQLQEKE